MKEKLIAIAVASVLAAPGLAFAQSSVPQSSVRISGVFKVSIDNVKVSQPSGIVGAHTGATNNSENRISDHSSRILFNVDEDLGGGLAATAQLDLRFNPDQASAANSAANEVGTGNTYVGLSSKTLGALLLGRFDLHYGKTPDDIPVKAGALMASSIALMDYISATPIAVTTRAPNVIRYVSRNWNGFAFTAAYSTNASSNLAVEADSTSVSRAGRAWNLNPSYTAANWGIGWTRWDSKPDAPVAVPIPTKDQKSDTVYGYYMVSGVKLGLGWNKAKLNNSQTGVETNKRTAWSLPVSYTTGNHTVYLTYTQAKDDAVTAVQDGAKLLALAYSYDLSKRTAVGVTYAKLNNDNGAVAGTGAMYQLFQNTVLGNPASGLAPGEDTRLIALTVRHAF